MPRYETDSWPYIPARDFRKAAPGRFVRLLVIHDMEAPEKISTAEDVARYFQRPDKPSSAHICVDNDSIVQCVKDNDVAYAAPGANHDGIQIELAGYGSQKFRDWVDTYGISLLAHAAYATAQYCLKYDIPVRKLDATQVRAGQKGICGHVDVTNAYHESDHTDPGKYFPWDYFIRLVVVYRDLRLAVLASPVAFRKPRKGKKQSRRKLPLRKVYRQAKPSGRRRVRPRH